MSAPPFSHHSKPVNLILESFFLFLAITTNNAVSYADMKEVAAIRSLTALSSFSKMPLRLGIFVGIIFGIISLLLIIYSLVMWVMNTPVSGYTTIVVFLSAFASLQFFLIGLIGQYVGYIFDEVKGRPIYVVQEIIEHEGQES